MMFSRLSAALLAALVCVAGTVGATAAHAAPPVSPIMAPGAATTSRSSTSATVDAANTAVFRNYSASGTGDPNPFTRLDVQMAPEVEPSGIGYFYMGGFWFNNGNPYGGYAGLQTALLDNCFTTGCVNVGHGFIFSIWGALGGYANRPAHVESGVELGQPFVSIHYSYWWVVGHVYRYVVTRSADANFIFNGQSVYQVNAWIVDDTAGTSTNVGGLYIPASWAGLQPSITDETEEYLPNSYPTCADIRFTQSLWTNVALLTRRNGAAEYPASTGTQIQAGTGCTNSAVIDYGGGNFRELIGT